MFGQEYYRHNVTVSLGAAMPRGELRNLFSDSFLAGVEYGYRFHRNFQLDAGFDSVFGAAGVNDWLPTAFGNLRIRDYQSFVPFGGRVILPLLNERVNIYGGLGGVYMRYSERIKQPFQYSDIRIPCDVCAARDGFGYYGIFGGSYALDSGRHFGSVRPLVSTGVTLPVTRWERPRREKRPIAGSTRSAASACRFELFDFFAGYRGGFCAQFSRITSV